MRLYAFLLVCALLTPSASQAAEDMVDQYCSSCHTPKTRPLDKVRLTRDDWKDTIERMLGYGADIPKSRIPALLDYLAETHGPSSGTADTQKK